MNHICSSKASVCCITLFLSPEIQGLWELININLGDVNSFFNIPHYTVNQMYTVYNRVSAEIVNSFFFSLLAVF